MISPGGEPAEGRSVGTCGGSLGGGLRRVARWGPAARGGRRRGGGSEGGGGPRRGGGGGGRSRGVVGTPAAGRRLAGPMSGVSRMPNMSRSAVSAASSPQDRKSTRL